jgi:hypothetical protein
VELIRVELEPPQPEPVVRAVERLLEAAVSESDPWWAAGIEEALRSGNGVTAEDAWGAAGVVEP